MAVIAVLTFAAEWFIQHQSKGTINEREGNFAVKDASAVSKIVLTDTEKKKAELTNTNGIWMVNGKYAAREELVKQLLECVTRLTSLCPVPTAAHDNVIREMMTHHVRTEVFDSKNNSLYNSFIKVLVPWNSPSKTKQSTKIFSIIILRRYLFSVEIIK